MTPPPVPGKPEDLRPRRVAKIMLFAASILGSVVFAVIFFAIPVFNEMFADFGAELPTITKFFISARAAYLPLAAIFGITSYLLLYGRLQQRGSLFLVLGLLSLEYAVFVLSFAAIFMPIFQLGAVSSN